MKDRGSQNGSTAETAVRQAISPCGEAGEKDPATHMSWSRRYLRDLLHDRDPIKAVFELASIWNSRAARNETDPYFGLVPCQYAVNLYLNYQGDVGNGGHSQFFMNPVGAYANETLLALRRRRERGRLLVLAAIRIGISYYILLPIAMAIMIYNDISSLTAKFGMVAAAIVAGFIWISILRIALHYFQSAGVRQLCDAVVSPNPQLQPTAEKRGG